MSIKRLTHILYLQKDKPLFQCWIRTDEVTAPSAGPNTNEWHRSKVTVELWHRLFMSETSLNIHNPGGIREGLVRQDGDISLHSARLYPSLLSSHRPPSISPLPSVALFTPQCRNSGPKMETQNVWKTLLHTWYQLRVFFHLTRRLLCENISLNWKHSDSVSKTIKSQVLLMLRRWKQRVIFFFWECYKVQVPETEGPCE